MARYINSIKQVIENGYCVGCGVCTAVEGSTIGIQLDADGFFRAQLGPKNPASGIEHLYSAVCPFSSEIDENCLADAITDRSMRHWHDEIGFYRMLAAGYVKSGTFRSQGSSGGIATWVLSTLLADGFVDAVIHVAPREQQHESLFGYTVSTDLAALRMGAKSRYYPVTLAEALKVVREHDAKYAIVGVPCYIKAIRLLQHKDPLFMERIVFAVGLVCGHMKSTYFAEALAMELNLDASNLSSIDFRAKTGVLPASHYKVRATSQGCSGCKTREEFAAKLYSYDWGYGLFRNSACDFCDDVFAETADISIGDAWVRPFVSSPHGTNVVITRTNAAQALLEQHVEDLSLTRITEAECVQSQAGGLRDRREGLKYRLHLKDAEGVVRPKKRFMSSDVVPMDRKKMYERRMVIRERSFLALREARISGEFATFKRELNSLIAQYRKGHARPYWYRILAKLKTEMEFLRCRVVTAWRRRSNANKSQEGAN